MPVNDVESQKPRILVVDDDECIRELLQILLEPRFHVTVAENGKQALHLLDQPDISAGYSVCVCDIGMPFMDGLEFYERLKQRPQDGIPVILMSAEPGKYKDRLAALGINKNDVLEKPDGVLYNLTARIKQCLTQDGQ